MTTSVAALLASGSIKSIQRGTVQVDGNSGTNVTITAVNPAKTELRFLGFSSFSDDVGFACRISLTNSTTITAVRGATYNGGTYATVSWELTEWN